MDKQALEEDNNKRAQKPNDGASVNVPVQYGYSTPQSSGLDEGRTLRSSARGKNSTSEINIRNMSSLRKAKIKSSIPRPFARGKDSTPRVSAKAKSVTPEFIAQNVVSPPKSFSRSKDNNPRPSPQGKNDSQMSSVLTLSNSPRATRSMSSTLTPVDPNITQRPSPSSEGGTQGALILDGSMSTRATIRMGSPPNATETHNAPSFSPQRKCGAQGSSTLSKNSSPKATHRSMRSTPISTATGEIGILIPSLQGKGIAESPAIQGKHSTQKVTTRDVDITTRSLAMQGDSNSESIALSADSASKLTTQDETGFLTSPTRGKDNNPRPSPQGKNDNKVSSVLALSNSPRATRSMSSTLAPIGTNITQRPSPSCKGGTQGASILDGGMSTRATICMGSPPNATDTHNAPSFSPQRKCGTLGSSTLSKSGSPRAIHRSMHSTPLSTATGDIGILIPSLQGKGSASELTTRDNTVILTSPTRGRRATSKLSAPPESSSFSSPTRVVRNAAASSVKGEYSIPRRSSRGKGEAVAPANQIETLTQQKHSSDASCLDEKGSSVEKHTVEDPYLAEKCVSGISSSSEIVTRVASLPSEVDGSVALFSNVVLPSLPVPPSGFDTSLTQYHADVSASVASCPVEGGTSVPPCPSEVCPGDIDVPQASCLRVVDGSITTQENEAGYSKASVLTEKDAIRTLDKCGTVATSGEDATSSAPVLNDGSVLPVMSSDQVISVEDPSGGTPFDKETTMGSSYCTVEALPSFQSSDTRDAPSVVIFNSTVETFLEKLVEAGSYQRFAKCYERFYKFQPEMTRSIYDQFIGQLKTSFKDEIQEIKEEGNLEALLDSLDKIKVEAKSRVEPAWRPSGIPEEDLQSNLVPYYLQQKEYMRKVLKEKEKENAKLAESVLAGRKRIAELQRLIQTRKESWQAMGKAKTELVMSLQELKSENWDH